MMMMMIIMTTTTTTTMMMITTIITKTLQKTAVLGTAHILRSERKTNKCTILHNHNMAVTFHTLDTCFVPGIYYL